MSCRNTLYNGFTQLVKQLIIDKLISAWDFSEGLAAVELDGEWGFIDKTGKEVIPLIYDDVEVFREGLAVVKLNEKWAYFTVGPLHDTETFTNLLCFKLGSTF